MEKLRAGNFYHIYNRGIDSTDLFLEESNFNFFLKKYAFYMHLTTQTYAYCLMSNHFHFLIKIRTIEEQEEIYNEYAPKLSLSEECWAPHGCKYANFKTQSTSRQLAHLFSTYAKNFNSWNIRTGKLFESPFKRIKIDTHAYLLHLICYIHRNPIHHQIADNYQNYLHSSHRHFLTDTETLLERAKVLEWFGGRKQFMIAHQEMKNKITPSLTLE